MMIDLAQGAQYRSIPLEDYEELFQKKSVLPHTYIWLAANNFGEGMLAKTRHLRIKVGDVDTVGYGTTINVGHFVAHVVRVPLKNGEALQIGGQLAPAIVSLWPQRDAVTWPPSVLLDLQQVALLGQMIEASPMAIV